MAIQAATSDSGEQNPVLLACSDESRATLADKGSVQRCTADTYLLQEGEPAGVVLFPLSGSFQISKTTERGRRQVLCNLSGPTCGGICLLTMADRSLANVTAVTDGEVLTVGRADFQALARADSVLCQAGWSAAVECMSHFSNLVEHLSFRKVAERVALVLLENTENDGDLLRLTQAELAAEVGTTREVVARCLAGLQSSGAVRLGRARITVRDRARLESGLG
jgi:CRP/FNR family transcriptional regulator